MYQFTREFIVNDLAGKLVAKTVGSNTFVTAPYADADGNTGKLATDSNKLLYIDNLINIDPATVVGAKYYYNLPVAATPEKVKAYVPTVGASTDFGALAVGDVVRLQVVLGQDGRVISTYNDQYPDHHNQIFVEATVTTADRIPLYELVANAAKADKRLENVLANLATDATASAAGTYVEVDAVDEFTRVRAIKLVKVKAAYPNAAILTGFQDYVELLNVKAADFVTSGTTAGTVVIAQAGNVGQGTTNCILRNMRLLTAAHLDPFGTQLDERPVPNSKYTQYTIEIETKRSHIGHQVMGAQDTSLTTLVFYVKGEGNATDASATEACLGFQAALTAAGLTKELAH